MNSIAHRACEQDKLGHITIDIHLQPAESGNLDRVLWPMRLLLLNNSLIKMYHAPGQSTKQGSNR